MAPATCRRRARVSRRTGSLLGSLAARRCKSHGCRPRRCFGVACAIPRRRRLGLSTMSRLSAFRLGAPVGSRCRAQVFCRARNPSSRAPTPSSARVRLDVAQRPRRTSSRSTAVLRGLWRGHDGRPTRTRRHHCFSARSVVIIRAKLGSPSATARFVLLALHRSPRPLIGP